MANKGLIGVQMSTIAPAKMPHFDAYESMGKLADIGYHCVEISQVPMTAENVAGFRKAIDELGLNVSSCTASTSPMLPGMPGEFLCNPDDYKKIVEDCRKLDCDMLRIGMLPMTCMGNYQKAVDFAKEANEYALKLNCTTTTITWSSFVTTASSCWTSSAQMLLLWALSWTATGSTAAARILLSSSRSMPAASVWST